jgi:predicted glycoside hydrolase/deacetylase ChbG (UPF0249 family)
MILVANADDAGVDRARNRGILKAAREGVVRSASLLVTFEAAADFAREARGVEALGVGLHANFSEGSPLVKGHRSLTGGDGRFPGKRELWKRAASGGVEPREAARELAAQLERLQALGIQPTHLDGHNHAHLFPGIAEAVAEVLPAGAWVRLPRSPGGAAASLPDDLYAEVETKTRALEALAARALALGWSRFRSADRFEGLSLPPGYSAAELISLLRSIDCGADAVVELMSHPGETTGDSVPFSASADRRRELEALTDPCLLGFVSQWDIRLRSFGDLR